MPRTRACRASAITGEPSLGAGALASTQRWERRGRPPARPPGGGGVPSGGSGGGTELNDEARELATLLRPQASRRSVGVTSACSAVPDLPCLAVAIAVRRPADPPTGSVVLGLRCVLRHRGGVVVVVLPRRGVGRGDEHATDHRCAEALEQLGGAVGGFLGGLAGPADHHDHVDDGQQLAGVVGGEDRRGVEQDVVEVALGRLDEAALGADHLGRRDPLGLVDDAGHQLHAGDGGVEHLAGLAAATEVAVQSRAAEVAVDDEDAAAVLGEHGGEVRHGGGLALGRAGRGDHQHDGRSASALRRRRTVPAGEMGAARRCRCRSRCRSRPRRWPRWRTKRRISRRGTPRRSASRALRG